MHVLCMHCTAHGQPCECVHEHMYMCMFKVYGIELDVNVVHIHACLDVRHIHKWISVGKMLKPTTACFMTRH